MRTALIASLSLAWIGGAALAETRARAPSEPASLTLVQATPAGSLLSGTWRTKRGRARRTVVAEKRAESARGSTSPSDALSSCLALWEPATHMTKRQWARACQRVAERLKDTTLR
ncbi:MAG TPA: hypothetical protein VH913_16120 [Hyphomicrobiaceae bacterium]|jgi:hypothetical protein